MFTGIITLITKLNFTMFYDIAVQGPYKWGGGQ